MHIVTISVRKGRSEKEKKALLDAVHGASLEAFRIPFNDRIQRIMEFSREEFEIPAGKGSGFTVVEITTAPRKLEEKRLLYEGIARRVRNFMDPKDVIIVLNVQPAENFGVRGGVCAADV